MQTTPDQQKTAAEAAREDGRKLAEEAAKNEKKPAVSEATGTSPATGTVPAKDDNVKPASAPQPMAGSPGSLQK